MRHDDDLDRILSEEEEFLPSSGFTASVMEAVRREASTPPPIPFPWKRALPGLAAAALALVLVLVEVSAFSSRGAAAPWHLGRWLSVLAPILEVTVTAGGHWVVLALLLTFASVRLSMRLARAIP
jgi:hypothetical protein